MNRVSPFLVTIIIISCGGYEYKQCNFESDDRQLKIYNDILIELVEQRFFNRYLGHEGERLYEKYWYTEQPDTVRLQEEIVKLQNKIYEDTVKMELCYRQTLQGPWLTVLEVKNDSTQLDKELFRLLKTVSPDIHAVADTLARVQETYSAKEFHLCTAKVIPFKQWNECGIGIVGFSKIFIDQTGTKALLYYEFSCPGNCGMGEIILVEEVHNKWTIRKSYQTWVS